MQQDQKDMTILLSNQNNLKKQAMLDKFRLFSWLFFIACSIIVGTFVISVLILGKAVITFINIVTIEGFALLILGALFSLAGPSALMRRVTPQSVDILAKTVEREQRDGMRSRQVNDALFLGLLGLLLLGIAMVLWPILS
ncbi:MAG: hypothetical protein ACE5I5_11460 [Candidatus Heimdallarchaeota archaeon]